MHQNKPVHYKCCHIAVRKICFHIYHPHSFLEYITGSLRRLRHLFLLCRCQSNTCCHLLCLIRGNSFSHRNLCHLHQTLHGQSHNLHQTEIPLYPSDITKKTQIYKSESLCKLSSFYLLIVSVTYPSSPLPRLSHR